jgi:hypothetical protein
MQSYAEKEPHDFFARQAGIVKTVTFVIDFLPC